MRFDGAAPRAERGGPCVFCDREALAIVLAETASFFVLADNAPLVEGHLLIVPREHYDCFGAIPAALDEELLALKRRIAAFCAAVYRPASYFEHGVFGQSVPHAHLHVVPLGASGLRVGAMAEPDGRAVATPAEVRAWYEEWGHYVYLESPPDPAEPFVTEAAIFPPREGPYGRVLTMLRERSHLYNPWQPQFLRRMNGQPKMQSLAEKWRAFADEVEARVE